MLHSLRILGFLNCSRGQAMDPRRVYPILFRQLWERPKAYISMELFISLIAPTNRTYQAF